MSKDAPDVFSKVAVWRLIMQLQNTNTIVQEEISREPCRVGSSIIRLKRCRKMGTFTRRRTCSTYLRSRVEIPINDNQVSFKSEQYYN